MKSVEENKSLVSAVPSAPVISISISTDGETSKLVEDSEFDQVDRFRKEGAPKSRHY